MAPYILQTVFLLLVGVLVLGFVVASSAALWSWRGGWRWLAGLPLLYVIGVASKIAVDISADPTAHNLWPFEVLGAVIIAFAVLGALQLLRFLAGRRVTRNELT